MIDSEYKFGAFVPVIPKIYKDAANDNANDAGEEEKKTEESISSSACYVRSKKWSSYRLISTKAYNHDTSIFEFELPDSEAYLNLPITDHLLIRAPACSEEEEFHVRPYTAVEENKPGKFKIMVKRYPEWGVPEEKQKKENKFFFFVKTDHSYKPPGKVSNHIHSLRIGQTLDFKYDPNICQGKIQYPFSESISALTMIAVGAGVAPMIRVIRAILEGNESQHVKKIRLLYGARTVADILQREQLDKWHDDSSDDRFKVCYCIGSRWNNIHFAAKTSSAEGPPLPKDYEKIPSDRKELGWANSDKVKMRGASNASDPGHRIFICGLPSVYISLAGSRFEPGVAKDSQLYRLGYRDHQVVKF